MDDFACANDLMNWLNTLENKTVEKKDVYRWAMDWRPPSMRRATHRSFNLEALELFRARWHYTMRPLVIYRVIPNSSMTWVDFASEFDRRYKRIES